MKKTILGLLLIIASAISLNVNADMTVDTEIMDFGNVAIGDNALMRVNVWNNGTEILQNVTVTVVNPKGNFVANNCSTLIWPGSYCEVTILFLPSKASKFAKMVTVEAETATTSPDEQVDSFTVAVKLRGRGY